MKVQTEFTNIKTDESIQKCLEYSENKKALKKLLSVIDVELRLAGIKKYFVDDKKERLTGEFKISRNGKNINFNFGFSLADTDMALESRNINKISEFWNDALYSVLACVSADYYCPIDFDEFCDEYGYERDSIKHRNIWQLCLKQRSKLEKIFSDSEIECLPR